MEIPKAETRFYSETGRGKVYSEEFKEEVAAAVLVYDGDGSAIGQTAKKYGISHSLVGSWFTKYGDRVREKLMLPISIPGEQNEIEEGSKEEPQGPVEFEDFPANYGSAPHATVLLTLQVPRFFLPLHEDQIDKLMAYVRGEILLQLGEE